VEAGSFADIAAEFDARVRKIVWCTMTTVDRKGRPRTRVIHPIWQGSTGYIVTGRHSFKAKHLAQNPYASISYWSPEHGLVVADVKCEWEDDVEKKKAAWAAFKAEPMPYGYDPEMLGAKPDDPESGLLVLKPWRVELHSLAEVMQNRPATVWRAGE
jgi:uncharacterized pyridoxamine 5'-phosphate oxidase family protein